MALWWAPISQFIMFVVSLILRFRDKTASSNKKDSSQKASSQVSSTCSYWQHFWWPRERFLGSYEGFWGFCAWFWVRVEPYTSRLKLGVEPYTSRLEPYTSRLKLYTFEVRWYWFILAMQFGYMYREFLVIQHHNGWSFSTVLPHISMWVVYVCTCHQTWQFSKVRPRARKSIDQILDMVLLPINYSVLCQMCVRMLVLQNSPFNQRVALVTLDSADIWESMALFSVLKLFATIVDRASHDRVEEMHNHQIPTIDDTNETGSRYLELVAALKRLSIYGVISWVVILISSCFCDILVKFLSPLAPGLCFYLFGSCNDTCNAWYDINVYPYVQGVVYVLCCFALTFVVAFERAFKDDLHRIEPYYKFWGVKILVTSTYFQWLIVRYCLGLTDLHTVYLIHSWLVCVVELPLLSFFHIFYAYPSGEHQGWIRFLLAESNTERDEVVPPTIPPNKRVEIMMCIDEEDGITQDESVAIVKGPDSLESAHKDSSQEVEETRAEVLDEVCRETTIEDHDENIMNAHEENATEPVGKDDVVEEIETRIWGDGDVERESAGEVREEWLCACYSFLGATASCFVSATMVCALVPVNEQDNIRGFSNFRCGQLQKYVNNNPSKHLKLNANSTPEYLPLCMSTSLDCRYGYEQHGDVTATCQANGKYTIGGICRQVGCGPPRQMQNAQIFNDTRNYKSGSIVNYTCDDGYSGSPQTICTRGGMWKSIRGKCKIVGCGALDRLRVSLDGIEGEVGHKSQHSSVFGEEVMFKCQRGLRGNPLSTCLNGSWITTDKCTPFNTSSGCKCKKQWTHCAGFFDPECKAWYGCATTEKGFAWCNVELGSCAGATKGFFTGDPWDYCTTNNFNISWEPSPKPDKYVGHRILLVMVLLLIFGVACLGARFFVFLCENLMPNICRMLSKCDCMYQFSRMFGGIRRKTRILSWRLQMQWECHIEPTLRRLWACQHRANARELPLLDESDDYAYGVGM